MNAALDTLRISICVCMRVRVSAYRPASFAGNLIRNVLQARRKRRLLWTASSSYWSSLLRYAGSDIERCE